MKPKHFLIVTVLVFAFFALTFLNPYPYGYDSFYYLNVVCNGVPFVGGELPLTVALFSLIPCNLIVIKLLLFGCCLSACLSASLLGEHFVKDKGWLAGVFVFASFLWLQQFWAFENEAFAFALLFSAAWLFYSGGWKKKAIAWCFAFLACGFWLGSSLMLAVFALSNIFTAIPLCFVAGFFHKAIIANITPTQNLQETAPGFGLFYQGLLFVSLMFWRILPALFVPITFFSLIAFVNMRFACFATFFLAILAAKQASYAKTRMLRALPYIGVAIVVMFFVGMFAVLPPTSHEVDAVQLAVVEADGNMICNQWGFGHMVEFFGGVASDRGGGQQQCVSCENCIMLAYECPKDCVRLNEADVNLTVSVCRC